MYCSLLTALSLTVLVAFCPHLRDLDISYTKLTVADMINVIIVPDALQQLEELHVGMVLHPGLIDKPEVANSRWKGIIHW